MSCFETQKADGNTMTSGMDNGNTYATNSVESCIKPQEFDNLCDYNSSRPFANLVGPPQNSKIKEYWENGDVKAPLANCALTFTEYMSWQSMPKGSNMVTKSGNIPSGNGYTGKGNGLNNPINISFGKISKTYWGDKSQKKMADGQMAAVFPDMVSGLAAAMHWYVENYHGLNMCQLNNRHQGYVSLDGKEIHDCVGMAALRLRWVTNNCKQTGVKPDQQLNLKDKKTLFTMVNSASKVENGLTFQQGFLEEAYKKIPIYLKA